MMHMRLWYKNEGNTNAPSGWQLYQEAGTFAWFLCPPNKEECTIKLSKPLEAQRFRVEVKCVTGAGDTNTCSCSKNNMRDERCCQTKCRLTLKGTTWKKQVFEWVGDGCDKCATWGIDEKARDAAGKLLDMTASTAPAVGDVNVLWNVMTTSVPFVWSGIEIAIDDVVNSSCNKALNPGSNASSATACPRYPHRFCTTKVTQK